MDRMMIPTKADIESMIAAMNEKSPSANGHSQKGNSPEGQAQNHCTSFAALRQEAMEILSQLPQEDAEAITQQARELIRGRA